MRYLWEMLELCDSRESVVQSQLSLSDTPLRCRRGLRRLPQEPRLALDLWELLELCDSRESVVQSQLLLSDTSLRPNRGPYRRGLRSLPRGASPGIATLALILPTLGRKSGFYVVSL
jgi:hypothetical protein